MTTAIRNGQVWMGDAFHPVDVAIADGRITALRKRARAGPGEIVDASGCLVLPGFIDVHTHLDDCIGPYQLADDYRTGTACAVENGITTVAAFITEGPDLPLRDAVQVAHDRACGRSFCHVTWHITPTRFDADGWRAVRDMIEQGCRTIKLYSTYRNAGIYADYKQMEAVFRQLAGSNVYFLVHCEDDAMLQAAAESISDWGDPAVHPAARPPEAEAAAIRAVLAGAARQHAALHIVHVSTPAGADLIAEARAGQRVTCETAPHYLFLDSSMLQRKDGHRWLCSPPLRESSMREGLLERARRGMFDMFATDHCAFHVKDKDTGTEDIRTVPNGIAGIGALPHLVADLYREKAGVEWKHLVRTLSENPARLLGLYPHKGVIAVGADADLVVLAPDAHARPVRSTYADAYEPYPGRTTTLGISAVLVQGNLVVRDGAILDSSHPAGRCLWPS